MEDLHWVDPSTLEFLDLLVAQGPPAGVFSVLTFRPEFSPPWAARGRLAHLTIGRLPRSHVEVMIERVTGGRGLPTEVLDQVVVKTDGVPLFVEELTKMVVESGLLKEASAQYELTGPLPPLSIPATLQDSLKARLDRLATVNEVAQLGATLGRTFTYEVLEAVSSLDAPTLRRDLARLVQAGLLDQRGMPPAATYLFKHALIQDAAYQALLRSARQQYHDRIARTLEERFPATAEAEPELLAHHYTEAGLGQQAVPYWQRAGLRAIQQSANREAIAHLGRGLELLADLPDGPERAQQELILQMTLGVPLMATKGYAAPEVEVAFSRARALSRAFGESPLIFPVLWGLWAFHVVRAEHQTARELAEQLMRLAQTVQDPALLTQAHFALGLVLVYFGELAAGRAHFEEAVSFYDLEQHRFIGFQTGQDPGGYHLELAGAHPLAARLSRPGP